MADLANLVARLEAVASRLEASTKGGAPVAAAAASAGSSSSSPSVEGYDEILQGSVKTFTSLCSAVGGELSQLGSLVEKAFTAQRAMIEVASKSKKPSDADLPAILADTSAAIVEIQNYRETHRRSAQANHLAAVSEGIPALGWVTVSPKPAPFVKEMKDAAAFYFNRVLKDFKDSDKQQCEWAKAFAAILDELEAYVKRVHTTGLVWNATGGDAKAASGSAPKPASAPTPTAKPSAGEADVKNSLFAALSKGDGVTSGLKKVEKSEMTHKNPALRASSVVPASATATAPAATVVKSVGKTETKKDPVFELQGKKWAVEHHSGNPNIVIDDCNFKQSVYIYKCDNCTVQIKGKINSISVDSCKKVALVFESALALCEVVNSQSLQVQVIGTCPTVSIDKTDGFQLYLSEASLETQIISAKSSEMNILIPGGPDGDMIELPVPEQYKTVVKDGKLHTEISEIAG